jgi:hypothetical protein
MAPGNRAGSAETGKLIPDVIHLPGARSRCARGRRARAAACRIGSDYLADERPQPQKSLPLKLSHPVSGTHEAQIEWHRITTRWTNAEEAAWWPVGFQNSATGLDLGFTRPARIR